MDSLKLRALAHSRFSEPIGHDAARPHDVFEKLAMAVSDNIRSAIGNCENPNGVQAVPHMLTSTIFNMCFTVGDIDWPAFRSMIAAQAPGAAPTSLVSAYECAGWGYALRYYLKYFPEHSQFLITVLDLNVYDFEHWRCNRHWESSGFGCTTLLFERNAEAEEDVTVGAAGGANTLMEFASAINRVTRADSSVVLALPFFPDAVFRTLRKSIGETEALENGHPKWGHCFGSDPWIAIAGSRGMEQRRRFLACSLALNGYYSIAKVEVGQDMTPSISERRMSAGDLARRSRTITSKGSIAVTGSFTNGADRSEYRGTLVGRPFGKRATRASTTAFPLRTSHDFEAMTSFSRRIGTAVLLSHAEHLEFLGSLVGEILDRDCDTGLIVVRMRMPSQGRLPKALLRNQVLLLDDLDGEPNGLKSTEKFSVLQVEDDFLRTPLEKGTNSITVRTLGQNASEMLGDLVPWLSAHGIEGSVHVSG